MLRQGCDRSVAPRQRLDLHDTQDMGHGSTNRRSVPTVTAWRRASTSIRTPRESQNEVALMSAITTTTPGPDAAASSSPMLSALPRSILAGERAEDRLGPSRGHGLGLRHGDHLRGP
jgi:hypothetical protein